MKKLICLFLSMIIVLAAMFTTSCSSSSKGEVLQDNREIESISVRLTDAGCDYELSGDDYDNVVGALKLQNTLEKESVLVYVGKESVTRTGIYKLRVSLKKTLFKKAESYDIMIGVQEEYTNISGVKQTNVDANEIRMSGYTGIVYEGLKKTVTSIVEREDNNYFDKKNDEIIEKFSTEGYQITNMENLNDNTFVNETTIPEYLDNSLDVSGIRAHNGSEFVVIILCKTKNRAIEYSHKYVGSVRGRFFYSGSYDSYRIIENLL